MLNNKLLRILVGFPLAAGITYLLYVFMLSAITKDEVTLAEQSQRELGLITPKDLVKEISLKRPKLSKEIDSDRKPPPPPKVTVRNSDIDMPAITIDGKPATIQKIDPSDLIDKSIFSTNRKAKPISTPVPMYPRRAAERGLEGDCNVTFDVSRRGEPFNVTASCSNKVFVNEAVRAVSKAKFAPKIVNGVSKVFENAVYPLQFRLQD